MHIFIFQMNVLRILLLLLLSLSIVHCEPIELPELVLRERTIHQNRLIYKFNQSIHEQYSYRFVHRDNQRYFTLNSSTGELYLRETILPNYFMKNSIIYRFESILTNKFDRYFPIHHHKYNFIFQKILQSINRNYSFNKIPIIIINK